MPRYRHRFLVITFIIVLFMGHAAAGAANPENFEALVGPIVEEAMHNGPVAGLTVGISQGGQQVFAKGYGVADLENAAAASEETVYRINSITKSFTATAILQLRDQHRLELDEPVGQLLPKLPQAWQRATIKQLLTHSSGLPNYGGKLFRENIGKDLSNLEWVRSMADQELLFEPGSGWSYSNLGYDILGLVIEKLSGTSYEDYIRMHLTGPLGLEHTRLPKSRGDHPPPCAQL